MDEIQQPGIQNPKIIDLIERDSGSGEVVLSMFESRPWPHEEKLIHSRLVQLQNKVDSYLSYVLDGFMKQQYPQYADLPVKIELKCIEEPCGNFIDFMKAAEDFASTEQIVFSFKVMSYEDIAPYLKVQANS